MASKPHGNQNPTLKESRTFRRPKNDGTYPFLAVCFDFRSEPEFEVKMCEQLNLEVKLTCPPGRHLCSSYVTEQLWSIMFGSPSPLGEIMANLPQRCTPFFWGGVAKTYVPEGRENLCPLL